MILKAVKSANRTHLYIIKYIRINTESQARRGAKNNAKIKGNFNIIRFEDFIKLEIIIAMHAYALVQNK